MHTAYAVRTMGAMCPDFNVCFREFFSYGWRLPMPLNMFTALVALKIQGFYCF